MQRRIGPYNLIELLGRGSSAVVYRAQDRRQGRTVALKLTRQRGDDAAERVKREVAIGLSLDHPNIAAVDALEPLPDGRWLIVMPLVEGKTLERVLVPTSMKRALSITEQVARGLRYAHARGVVHCDLKPANLILSGDEVKILDFGLARFLGEPFAQAGTLEYRSPEAVRGQRLTPQSDLWSLGIILYELLTGASPFRADEGASEAATLRRIAALEPTPPSALRLGLPAGTDALLARLLAKRPRERFGSAAKVLEALARLSAPSGVPLERGGAPLAGSATKTSLNISSLDEDNAHSEHAALVGRGGERALLDLYLQDPECHLVTLHGVGGVGKTALARASLRNQEGAGRFDETRFVSLQAVSSGLLAHLAAQLGCAVPGVDDLTNLRLHMRNARWLLVLDNLEGLKSEAHLLEDLLSACPKLKLLATSRERLSVTSEWVLPLTGLGVPGAGDVSVSQARQCGAVRLFEQQARGADFSLERDLSAVTEIARRLEGHPLSLKLVAGWTQHLSAEAALGALRDGGGLTRDLAPMFERSFRLLSARHQTLLVQLGVFRGSFDLDAAKAILGADEAALDGLLDAALLELSLTRRYAQHPLVAAFCRDRLTEETQPHLEARFARHYRNTLEELDTALSRAQPEVLEAVERDLGNLRAALRRGPVLTEAAEPLRVFYTQKGRYAEGRAFFAHLEGAYARACRAWFALLSGDAAAAEGLVEQDAGGERTRLLSLNVRAGLAWQRGEVAEAKSLSIEALHLAEAQQNAPMLAAIGSNLALLEEALGDLPAAVRYFEASLLQTERSGDDAALLLSLNNLAALHLSRRDVEAAQGLLERGLWVAERSKLSRLKPLLQSNLGLCLYAREDLHNARLAYQEALSALSERGEAGAAATVQGYLAQLHGAQGEDERARLLLIEALASAHRAGDEQAGLSVLVRFAELTAEGGPERAHTLAALVLAHPMTEAGDRRLAQTLATERPTALPSLAEAVEDLLGTAG